jgi:hypothetical protein
MSYQFGTNWSVFSDKVGPVIGPLMGYEVLSAFFLEAGFLGVMLFGRERVGPKLHFLATLMVALGTFMSAFWILAVNSWMQTPAGYAMNDVGQFVVTDWWAVIFNPSLPYRLVHMVLAAYLTTAQLRDGRQTIVVEVSPKDALTALGEVVNLRSVDLVDRTGAINPMRCFVVKIEPKDGRYRYTLQPLPSVGRTCFITSDDWPEYDDSTALQREQGGYISANVIPYFSDNSQAYKISE